MSFRNWLLTGTCLTLLALTPLSVARAQDATNPALVAAYQAFQADQSEANQLALTEACITAGFANLDECIAALANMSAVEQTSPEDEAAAAAAAQASAEAQAAAEQAAAEAQASAEAQAAADAQASAEAQAAAEAQASAEAQAAADAQASAEAQAAADAQASAEAQAAADAQASAEAQASAAPSSEAPVSSEAPTAETNDAIAQLTAAVELYNQGVAELTAGDANGQVKIDQANAQMTALCEPAGYPDIATCVAQFGLTLNPLPAVGETPAATSEEPLVGADEPVTEEATEVLPEDIAPEDAAPILDSEKDETAPLAEDGTTTTEQPSQEPVVEQPVAEEPVAPPADDSAAQQEIQPPPPEEQSALTGEGEAAGNFDFGFVDVEQAEADGGFVTPPADEDGQQIEVVQAPSANNPNFVFKIGIHIYITNLERERDRYYDRDEDEIYYERLSNGRIREVIERPNGVRIITIYNRYGDVLKRTKVFPDNREFYLASYDFDEEQDDGFFIDPGDELPPLRLTISAREYILDADEAEEDQVEEFLGQPPVEQVRRIYSIDEVKRSARLRDTVRRLEVGNLTFDTGKATISRDQVSELSKVANAILGLLERNPAEVFLIEGHTDAVGSDLSNLELSDERASTVARILTDFYDVPPENLATQGYGERYLKVKTTEAEELNRRVTFKRITPLVTYETASN